jgi:uncharacterized membrane-anchored protein YjiN (DUF445 family)
VSSAKEKEDKFNDRTVHPVSSSINSDAIGELIEKAKMELKENHSPTRTTSFIHHIGPFNDVDKPVSVKEKSLKGEVAKWKEFGHLLAESYDRLKKKYAKQVEAEKKGKQITEALKDQVNKLKALLNHCNAENKDLKQMLENSSPYSNLSYIDLEKRVSELMEENETLRKDKQNADRLVVALTQEKDILENEKTLNNKLVQQLNDKIKVTSFNSP